MALLLNFSSSQKSLCSFASFVLVENEKNWRRAESNVGKIKVVSGQVLSTGDIKGVISQGSRIKSTQILNFGEIFFWKKCQNLSRTSSGLTSCASEGTLERKSSSSLFGMAWGFRSFLVNLLIPTKKQQKKTNHFRKFKEEFSCQFHWRVHGTWNHVQQYIHDTKRE